MSEQPKSSEGLELLNRVENEYLKNANQDLVARNVDLSQAISELNTSIAVLQTAQEAKAGQTSAAAKIDSLAYTCARKHDLIPLMDTPSSPARSTTPIEVVASASATPDTSSPEFVPFFYGSAKGCKALIEIAKWDNPLERRYFMVVPKLGYIWKEAPVEGSYFKPSQRILKGGKITPHGKKKKFRGTLELLSQDNAGGWCYLGSFKATSWTTLGCDEFLALSASTQDAIIAQTPTASRLRDIRSMYVSGELVVVKIDMEREVFDKDLYQYLLDAAAGKRRFSDGPY